MIESTFFFDYTFFFFFFSVAVGSAVCLIPLVWVADLEIFHVGGVEEGGVAEIGAFMKGSRGASNFA